MGIRARVTGRRFVRWVAVGWERLRRRPGWWDHLIRAGLRYDEADGGRLAAAVTYYAFFATFALGLLGFAVFGFVLDDPAILRAVERYFAENLPNVDVPMLRDARNTAGIIAFIGLPITGWFWVDVLRSSTWTYALTAWRTRSTSPSATMSRATRMALTTADVDDEPWLMTQTPSTPSRSAPP